MVLKYKLGHLVRTDFLPLKRISLSSIPPLYSTVLTLSKDNPRFWKTHLRRKKKLSHKRTSSDMLSLLEKWRNKISANQIALQKTWKRKWQTSEVGRMSLFYLFDRLHCIHLETQYPFRGAFSSELITVKTLYTDTLYYSKMLHNVGSVCTNVPVSLNLS